MNLPGRIETDRLIIRPFEPKDFKAFIEFMTNEDATRYLTFDTVQKTQEGAGTLFEFILSSYVTDDPVFALAIVDRSTETYLGSVGLSPLQDETGVEVYYSLLPKYWGWGFATEATAAVLYYAFEELELERVVADANEHNPKSFDVARNVGMRDEGSVERADNTLWRRFSMNKSDYFRQVGE